VASTGERWFVILTLPLRDTRLHWCIEPTCAQLCARRPDRNEEIVPELRRLNAVARDLIDSDERAFVDALLSFHHVIVDRCGSTTLALLGGIVDSISHAMLLHELGSMVSVAGYPRADQIASVEAHEEICDLISAGDAERVGQVMSAHYGPSSPSLISETQPIDPAVVRGTR
jgi:GntR family transcriptional repressor for pyruvate dehydrogenase complex